jgi:hypothetical protein
MALSIAATGAAICFEVAVIGASLCALRHRFNAAFLRPYRPELHYMRGPGPKWREKRRVPANCRVER